MSRNILSTLSESANLNEIPVATQNNTDQRISQIIQKEKNITSIEICPGKEFNTKLLTKLNPKFVSIPWIGNPDFKTPEGIPSIQLAKKLQENGYTTLLHVAGRNFQKDQLKVILEKVKNCGIRNIFAVQGDWIHVKEKLDENCDFPYASELVAFIKQMYGDHFCIGVAGYPDKHPLSASKKEDIRFLKKKVDSGADFIITQGIFDYSTLGSFISSCRELKIETPIMPGIFIANSHKSLAMIKNICQAEVPDRLIKSYKILEKDEDVLEDFVVEFTSNLVRDISRTGLCPGVHIFSLNNLEILEKVMCRC